MLSIDSPSIARAQAPSTKDLAHMTENEQKVNFCCPWAAGRIHTKLPRRNFCPSSQPTSPRVCGIPDCPPTAQLKSTTDMDLKSQCCSTLRLWCRRSPPARPAAPLTFRRRCAPMLARRRPRARVLPRLGTTPRRCAVKRIRTAPFRNALPPPLRLSTAPQPARCTAGSGLARPRSGLHAGRCGATWLPRA